MNEFLIKMIGGNPISRNQKQSSTSYTLLRNPCKMYHRPNTNMK